MEIKFQIISVFEYRSHRGNRDDFKFSKNLLGREKCFWREIANAALEKFFEILTGTHFHSGESYMLNMLWTRIEYLERVMSHETEYEYAISISRRDVGNIISETSGISIANRDVPQHRPLFKLILHRSIMQSFITYYRNVHFYVDILCR